MHRLRRRWRLRHVDGRVRHRPPVCLPIKVVNNNAALGQIMWEQLALGYPEFGIRFDHRPDFAPWAEACGGLGIRVDKSAELESAIAEAFA